MVSGVLYIVYVVWPLLFSALQFRFTEYQNESRTFCRRFTVSSYHNIPKLFYDCHWTRSSDFGKTFVFEYEAQNKFYREAGRYWFKLPTYSELGKKFSGTHVCVLSLWSAFRCNFSEYFKTTAYHYYYVHLSACNRSQTIKMILIKKFMIHLHLNFCWTFWILVSFGSFYG